MARTFKQLEGVRLETLSPIEWVTYVQGYRAAGWGVRWPLTLLVACLLHPLRHWVQFDVDTKRFTLVRVGDVRWDIGRDRYILIRAHGLRSVRGTYFSGQIVKACANGRGVQETCNALRFGTADSRPYAPVEKIVLP